VKLENLYASFEVQEIVREPYSGRAFPGFEEIDLSFEELETIMRTHASTSRPRPGPGRPRTEVLTPPPCPRNCGTCSGEDWGGGFLVLRFRPD